MIIWIFIAHWQPIDLLRDQFQYRMVAVSLAPAISKGTGNGAAQAHPLIDLGEERNAAVTGDVAAAEIGFDYTAFKGWEL